MSARTLAARKGQNNTPTVLQKFVRSPTRSNILIRKSNVDWSHPESVDVTTPSSAQKKSAFTVSLWCSYSFNCFPSYRSQIVLPAVFAPSPSPPLLSPKSCYSCSATSSDYQWRTTASNTTLRGLVCLSVVTKKYGNKSVEDMG